MVFGAFAGAVFYIATAADLQHVGWRICRVHIAGIICSRGWLVQSLDWTGYSDKPLDISEPCRFCLAVKILTFLNNRDIDSLVA